MSVALLGANMAEKTEKSVKNSIYRIGAPPQGRKNGAQRDPKGGKKELKWIKKIQKTDVRISIDFKLILRGNMGKR